MQLVVLAAGKGSRLGKSLPSRGSPKSLVEIVDGRPYLHYQLCRFKKFHFSKKIIVGGFGFSELENFINNFSHADIALIENQNFDKGNLISLLCAQDQMIEDDMFIFNADHYYSLTTYKKIFSATHKNIVIFCDQDRSLGDDDMKVQARDDQFITMSKDLIPHQWGYVGVTVVPREKINLYFQMARSVRQSQGDQVAVENVLNALAQRGELIFIVDISGSWWTEVDTLKDHLKAREIILSHE